jgi:hypothetical protein
MLFQFLPCREVRRGFYSYLKLSTGLRVAAFQL